MHGANSRKREGNHRTEHNNNRDGKHRRAIVKVDKRAGQHMSEHITKREGNHRTEHNNNRDGKHRRAIVKVDKRAGPHMSEHITKREGKHITEHNNNRDGKHRRAIVKVDKRAGQHMSEHITKREGKHITEHNNKRDVKRRRAMLNISKRAGEPTNKREGKHRSAPTTRREGKYSGSSASARVIKREGKHGSRRFVQHKSKRVVKQRQTHASNTDAFTKDTTVGRHAYNVSGRYARDYAYKEYSSIPKQMFRGRIRHVNNLTQTYLRHYNVMSTKRARVGAYTSSRSSSVIQEHSLPRRQVAIGDVGGNALTVRKIDMRRLMARFSKSLHMCSDMFTAYGNSILVLRLHAIASDTGFAFHGIRLSKKMLRTNFNDYFRLVQQNDYE
jgi:hypothetical protein